GIVGLGRRQVGDSIIPSGNQHLAGEKRRRRQAGSERAQIRARRYRTGRRIEDVARRERRATIGATDDEDTIVLEKRRGVSFSRGRERPRRTEEPRRRIENLHAAANALIAVAAR